MYGVKLSTQLDFLCFVQNRRLTKLVIPFDAVVVNPVWDAIDGNLGIGDVGIEEGFRVPGTRCVGYDE